MDPRCHVGTHSADPVSSVLPQLFAPTSFVVHARRRDRGIQPVRVSSIEQYLGGNCCRFCVPRTTGTHTTSPPRHCCCTFVRCSSCARGSRGLDFEPQRFDRCRVRAAFTSCIYKIQATRCDNVVRCFTGSVPIRITGKTLGCRVPRSPAQPRHFS